MQVNNEYTRVMGLHVTGQVLCRHRRQHLSLLNRHLFGLLMPGAAMLGLLAGTN
jgi:hypothetical protein